MLAGKCNGSRGSSSKCSLEKIVRRYAPCYFQPRKVTEIGVVFFSQKSGLHDTSVSEAQKNHNSEELTPFFSATH